MELFGCVDKIELTSYPASLSNATATAKAKIKCAIRKKTEENPEGFDITINSERCGWFENLLLSKNLACRTIAESEAKLVIKDGKKIAVGIGAKDLVSEDFDNTDNINTTCFSISRTIATLEEREKNR